MNSKCSICSLHGCSKESALHLPDFCPMPTHEGLYEEALALINSETYSTFYTASSVIEKEGYGLWPRVKETMALMVKMGYKKVGLAHCLGFKKEAKILTEILEDHGLTVISALCKTGGMDKTQAQLKEEEKIREGSFEAMCNPVAQAMLLNEQGTEFNIVLGLCVGHDSLFYKFSDALCTTLVVKDRVTGHNPVAALYGADGYFKNKLHYDEKKSL